MDTPRITITEQDQIKILVCHLIYSLGCPLSKSQLIEITSYEQAVNYFDLIQALENITDRLCTADNTDDNVYYSNKPLGVKAAQEFGETLPISIREKLFEEAVRVYTRDAMRRNKAVAIRYAQNTNGTCTVGISVQDEETGRQKYYINVVTDTPECAEKLKNKIKSEPEKFKKYLDSYFTE